jgi:hypothetical protein
MLRILGPDATHSRLDYRITRRTCDFVVDYRTRELAVSLTLLLMFLASQLTTLVHNTVCYMMNQLAT